MKNIFDQINLKSRNQEYQQHIKLTLKYAYNICNDKNVPKS